MMNEDIPCCEECGREIIVIEAVGENIAVCKPCKIERDQGPYRSEEIEGVLGTVVASVPIKDGGVVGFQLTALDQNEIGAAVCHALGYIRKENGGMAPDIPDGTIVRLTIEVIEEGKPKPEILVPPSNLILP